MGNIGSGTGTSYPTSLDTQSTLEVDYPSPSKTLARAAVPNDLASAILAVEGTLGINPQGGSATVVARLNATDTTIAGKASLTASQTLSGVNSFSAIVKTSRGADVASAATVTLGTDGNYFVITGTTTITAISTLGGAATTSGGIAPMVHLKFSGILTLTHNATSLILPGGRNIVTHAGMVVSLVEESAGNWRCVNVSSDKPHVQAYITANQTIAHATATRMGSNALGGGGWTETFDTNAAFDSSTSATTSGKFLPTVAGRYLAIVQIALGAATTIVDIYATIRLNGTATAMTNLNYTYNSADYNYIHATGIFNLNGSTDYLEFFCYQADTGTANRTLLAGAGNSFVHIYKLGE